MGPLNSVARRKRGLRNSFTNLSQAATMAAFSSSDGCGRTRLGADTQFFFRMLLFHRIVIWGATVVRTFAFPRLFYKRCLASARIMSFASRKNLGSPFGIMRNPSEKLEGVPEISH
jgi:hypothetical protein